ncbi:MAG: PQQ-binding-like beta-propeller repeat protein [Candidatus Hydrogenedentota bacterium]
MTHQLVRDVDQLERVRAGLRERGTYGRVSAVDWDGGHLPYTDNMVNLLFVSEEQVEISRSELDKEIDRVLAPLGVAYIEEDGNFSKHQKAWPDEIDEWTHARYDATGNPTSSDKRTGPPRHVQWEGSPRWNRGVKTSAIVSAGGRIFYVLDDSHFASSEENWSLMARDAFSGVLLWRRELTQWPGARGGKKVGPIQTERRVVTCGERVYAPLAGDAPISVLDAATGEVLRTLPETDDAEEVILSEGVLVVLVNPNTPVGLRRGVREPQTIVAHDAETGEFLWGHDVDEILPTTLAADGGQVVYHDGVRIESLDLRTGQERWASAPTTQDVEYKEQASPDSPGAEESAIYVAPQFGPTLILYEDVVAFAGGGQLNVVSAQDGAELWRGSWALSNYSVPVDLFGFGGLLWGPDPDMNLWRPVDDSLDVNGYDPRTGDLEEAVKGQYGFRFQHHRCHQMKAIGRTIIAGRVGVEFLDTETGVVRPHHWVRGSCHYGVMPGNGMLYAPPHDCACHVRAKLSGFFALKSERSGPPIQQPEANRLERGPAFGEIPAKNEAGQGGDWPTYRHDSGRSGRASTSVAPELRLRWQTDLGGDLAAPVAAEGRAFVASSDTHQLFALDADNGEVLWEYSFGGRVDSPPTIHEGLVLCGSRDGWVYALRAADGALVWRFRGAPERRWIVSNGQLESAWPVHGSVLVVDDTLYFAAGRSSYLDGGIHFYALEPHTGEKIAHKVLDSREMESPQDVMEQGIDAVDDRGEQLVVEVDHDPSQLVDEQGIDGYLNDVLSSDGDHVFMRHQVFDLEGNRKEAAVPHLHSPDGYLSGATTPRLLWTYAPMFTSLHQGAFYDQRLSRALFPSGRILVEDEEYIYGFGQNHYDDPRPETGGEWALFASAKEQEDVPHGLTVRQYRQRALEGEASIGFRWWRPVPINVWAMLQTDDVLFIAGPPSENGRTVASQGALTGESEATLLAVSARGGETLAEKSLPTTPVWDGMAAAGGRIFMTARDGRVLCLEAGDRAE